MNHNTEALSRSAAVRAAAAQMLGKLPRPFRYLLRSSALQLGQPMPLGFACPYLEYAGTDFDADMKRMAADPETQRWWQETDPCQSPLPDAAAAGKIWADTKEVFYLP